MDDNIYRGTMNIDVYRCSQKLARAKADLNDYKARENMLKATIEIKNKNGIPSNNEKLGLKNLSAKITDAMNLIDSCNRRISEAEPLNFDIDEYKGIFSSVHSRLSDFYLVNLFNRTFDKLSGIFENHTFIRLGSSEEKVDCKDYKPKGNFKNNPDVIKETVIDIVPSRVGLNVTHHGKPVGSISVSLVVMEWNGNAPISNIPDYPYRNGYFEIGLNYSGSVGDLEKNERFNVEFSPKSDAVMKFDYGHWDSNMKNTDWVWLGAMCDTLYNDIV